MHKSSLTWFQQVNHVFQVFWGEVVVYPMSPEKKLGRNAYVEQVPLFGVALGRLAGAARRKKYRWGGLLALPRRGLWRKVSTET